MVNGVLDGGISFFMFMFEHQITLFNSIEKYFLPTVTLGTHKYLTLLQAIHHLIYKFCVLCRVLWGCFGFISHLLHHEYNANEHMIY